MTIQLDDKSYIVGMWFSSDPVTNNDWLACVVRDPENPNRFIGWSRFRYIRDEKIFDSEDKKSWTNFSSAEGATENQMIAYLGIMQRGIEAGYPDMDQILVKGDLKKLIGLAKDKPWMNMKQERVH